MPEKLQSASSKDMGRMTEPELLDLLGRHYAGINAREVSPSEQGNIFKVDAAGGPYILKHHELLAGAETTHLEQICGACSEAGITPRLVASDQGNYLVRQEGSVFSLQESVQDDGGEIMPEALGRSVARLHATLCSLSIPGFKNHLQRAVTDIEALATEHGYARFLPSIKKVLHMEKSSPLCVIHGDMHRSNIIASGGKLLFIDFDSANIFLPASDVAFSAYRIFGPDAGRINEYVGQYNRHAVSSEVNMEDLWHLVIYNIVQRILLILIDARDGSGTWLWDIPNQERYLQEVAEYAHAL